MESCNYYRVEQQQQAREVQSSWRESKSGYVYIPYCTHPSGEFSLSNIKFCGDAINKLKCQGNISRCQLKNGLP
jgi:hypothetical protein